MTHSLSKCYHTNLLHTNLVGLGNEAYGIQISFSTTSCYSIFGQYMFAGKNKQYMFAGKNKHFVDDCYVFILIILVCQFCTSTKITSWG